MRYEMSMMFKELHASLDRVEERARQGLEELMRDVSDDIVEEWRKGLPKGLTGNAKKSIQAEGPWRSGEYIQIRVFVASELEKMWAIEKGRTVGAKGPPPQALVPWIDKNWEDVEEDDLYSSATFLSKLIKARGSHIWDTGKAWVPEWREGAGEGSTLIPGYEAQKHAAEVVRDREYTFTMKGPRIA